MLYISYHKVKDKTTEEDETEADSEKEEDPDTEELDQLLSPVEFTFKKHEEDQDKEELEFFERLNRQVDKYLNRPLDVVIPVNCYQKPKYILMNTEDTTCPSDTTSVEVKESDSTRLKQEMSMPKEEDVAPKEEVTTLKEVTTPIEVSAPKKVSTPKEVTTSQEENIASKGKTITPKWHQYTNKERRLATVTLDPNEELMYRIMVDQLDNDAVKQMPARHRTPRPWKVKKAPQSEVTPDTAPYTDKVQDEETIGAELSIPEADKTSSEAVPNET